MAFTQDEKSRILFYLGYSVFEDDGPAMRAINSLDSKEAQGGFIIRGLLADIEKVRCEIKEAMPLALAVKDGSIELRAHYTIGVLRDLGRSYVNDLAGFCKISIFSDIFSPGGRPREPKGFYNGDPSEMRIDPRGVYTR